MKMDLTRAERAAGMLGTPLYVYYEEILRANARTFYSAFRENYPLTRVLYAYKANSSLALCRILQKEGLGADVVSGGELETALKIGVPAGDIIYTNNAKTIEEIRLAIDCGVVLNVDSLSELSAVDEAAAEKKKKARISFRINPGVDPKTHAKIATGLAASKFGLHIDGGIALKAYKTAEAMDNVEIAGIHTHIGSQIRQVKPFVDAAEKVMEFVCRLRKEVSIELSFVDIGGGLGVPYQEEKVASPGELAQAVVPVIRKWNEKTGYEPELWLEPGRYMVADAGVLVSRVQTVKETPCKKFVNLDSGFNTLIRPAMYDAYHSIRVLGKDNCKPAARYDIAGNICESGDIFAKDRELPAIKAGDLLAILDAGAYGYSMASRYNSRPLPPEALVRMNGDIEVIRERETMEDVYRHQKIPKDLR